MDLLDEELLDQDMSLAERLLSNTGFPDVIDSDTMEVFEEWTGMYCKNCLNVVEIDEPVCLFCDEEYPESFWETWKEDTANLARPIILPVEWPFAVDSAYDIGEDGHGRECERCDKWSTDGCGPLMDFLWTIQTEGEGANLRPFSIRPCEDFNDR